MAAAADPFGSRSTLQLASGAIDYFRLDALESRAGVQIDRLPYTVRVLLESMLRQYDGSVVTEEDVLGLARWRPGGPPDFEFPFLPSRVLLQDFTGVPCVVDLAAMRSAVERLKGDPQKINPLVPVDLVIDHSVQVDQYGSDAAFLINVDKEYERNKERYALLRWAQNAFKSFRAVPPDTGIVHQVNLEYLAGVVVEREHGDSMLACPDSLVGTDSHTTMVNGLGVLGWGVGGIEAEAVMLGQPLYMLTPIVVGVRLTGRLREGATATDLVLTLTQRLREHGVVGKFVEFTGPGVSDLAVAERATLSNMAPEYGATSALFPVDENTLRYLRNTARPDRVLDLVERYTKANKLFRTNAAPEPEFDELVELDLSTVEPSLAGPRRPQDRVPLGKMRDNFRSSYPKLYEGAEGSNGRGTYPVEVNGRGGELTAGSVVIAAITSCTNTSNPSLMIGAGLLAKKARERGLEAKPYVKTSMAPGSRAVTEYLHDAGLTPYLDELGFNVVGYGCTTCIGNSGPLPDPVANTVQEHDLTVAAVLSGNRNFEGRIHPQVYANYLASPPLVVAYALAGTVDIDLEHEPLGKDRNGQDVYLREIWPSQREVAEALEKSVKSSLFARSYADVFKGDEHWRELEVPRGDLYDWDPESTYIQEPPFFTDLAPEPGPLRDIRNARVLVKVADSITTDHISPAGTIPRNGPAGQYLIAHDVAQEDFNSFGARRGNDRVMVRGTFANIRLKNELVPGKEGDWTVHLPDGEQGRIFDVSQRYQAEGTPLLVIAGKEYGTGSSRDWAAKGTLLLGVKAVIAESYERIHRSNLVGMGVLPLQFLPGESRTSLGLTGAEEYTVEGIADLTPGKQLAVTAKREDGSTISFQVRTRIDGPVELEYYRHGGILQYVLRRLVASS